MRFPLIAAFTLVLSSQTAFASDSAPGAAQSVSVAASSAAGDPEVPKFQCHQESDIGSMRMHKVCTKVPTDAERLATQDAIRNSLPNNSVTHPAAGAGAH